MVTPGVRGKDPTFGCVRFLYGSENLDSRSVIRSCGPETDLKHLAP